MKSEYFLAIQAGVKVIEFRQTTDFWKKRIQGRNYENVIITLGYPRREDHERRIVRPWRGYEVQIITHPHFGPSPVEVFAIYLTDV